MNKKLIYAILCISLTTISCGLQSQLPLEPKTAVKAVSPTGTQEPQYAMVCMAGTLNFRESAGTDEAVLVTLNDGAIVEVYEKYTTTIDGAMWRETSAGYANARYLCEEAE